jgi:hypothetical protein
MTMTLAELTRQTGLAVLDHLDRTLGIPVVDGLQAQGDLIIAPLAMVESSIQIHAGTWANVPAAGIELLRGEAGGNPHTLVADRGTCRWTAWVGDPERLTIGVFEATAPVYLLHAEHGATGVAPGTYAVRRQREREGRRARLVAD